MPASIAVLDIDCIHAEPDSSGPDLPNFANFSLLLCGAG